MPSASVFNERRAVVPRVALLARGCALLHRWQFGWNLLGRAGEASLWQTARSPSGHAGRLNSKSSCARPLSFASTRLRLTWRSSGRPFSRLRLLPAAAYLYVRPRNRLLLVKSDLNPQEIHMSTGLEGGCLCGNVRFVANQPPLRTFACHCNFCQRVTGTSFYAESIFPMEAVQFNSGELRCYEHVSAGSAKKVYVHFCPACGTTVGLTFERWPGCARFLVVATTIRTPSMSQAIFGLVRLKPGLRYQQV